MLVLGLKKIVFGVLMNIALVIYSLKDIVLKIVANIYLTLQGIGNILVKLIYLIPTTNLWGWYYYYYLNFTNKETEAKRGYMPTNILLIYKFSIKETSIKILICFVLLLMQLSHMRELKIHCILGINPTWFRWIILPVFPSTVLHLEFCVYTNMQDCPLIFSYGCLLFHGFGIKVILDS